MKLGVFDSGYGGLTILKNIRAALPHYDYIYLGDNARAPYGPRSFDVIYQYTLQAVRALFEKDCQLVILACNTASAKALRTIQQTDLPLIDSHRRVLGVIRPTVEIVGSLSQTRHVGIMATQGTVRSRTYEAFFPLIAVAVIYFFLEWLITHTASKLENGFDPKRRKKEEILKGITITD